MPRAVWATAVAQTLDTTTSPNERAAKLPNTTSRAKSTPATGALKVALMAPAAPAATMSFTSSTPSPMVCASVLPSDEPIWTMGPSRPREPPDPMEMALAIALAKATRGRMRPPLMRNANCTSGIPCPLASGDQ